LVNVAVIPEVVSANRTRESVRASSALWKTHRSSFKSTDIKVPVMFSRDVPCTRVNFSTRPLFALMVIEI
jgi:hypothetical protein